MSNRKGGVSSDRAALRPRGSGRRNGRSIVGQPGTDTIAKPARGSQVVLVIAKHALLFPLVFLPPMLSAFVEREWHLAVALALPALLGLTLWAAVYRVPLPRDLRQIEAVVVLALLFLLTALLSVPAFISLGMPALDSLFEGMSAITPRVSRSPPGPRIGPMPRIFCAAGCSGAAGWRWLPPCSPC